MCACVVGGIIEGGGASGGGGGGTGNVVGPASASDGSIALNDGTTGKLLKAGPVLSAFAATILDDADASAARTTLGVAIGTNVQAFDADLSAIAGLTSAADKGIQFTGAGAAATFDLTTAGKALLDDANAAAQLTTLGISAFVQTVLDDADAATVRATIGAGTSSAAPAGSGSEIQVRSSGTAFAAVTGSSSANGGLALVNQSAAAVPFSVTGAASQSGNLLNVTANGGAAGGLFNIASDGTAAIGGLGISPSATLPLIYNRVKGATTTRIGFDNGGGSGIRVWSDLIDFNTEANARRLVWAATDPAFRFGLSTFLSWYNNADPQQGSVDSGISRPAAADFAFGNGTSGDATATLKFGNARCRGRTTTAAAATTTEYPTDKDWGIHRNSNTAAVHLVYNDSGTIKSVQLT